MLYIATAASIENGGHGPLTGPSGAGHNEQRRMETIVGLYADRAMRIDSENAFKIGPHIRALEAQGRDIVKCNLGEPDFPVPSFIKGEIKRQIDLDNIHYCDPQGIPALRAAIAKQISKTRGDSGGGGARRRFPGRQAPHRFVPADLLRPWG